MRKFETEFNRGSATEVLAKIAVPATTPKAPVGLTSAEARLRFEQYGPNEIPQRRLHPVLTLLKKIWGPIPWMLEGTILTPIVLDKRGEASIVARSLRSMPRSASSKKAGEQGIGIAA